MKKDSFEGKSRRVLGSVIIQDEVGHLNLKEDV